MNCIVSPANLDKALAVACQGVDGITPAQFRALLSTQDIRDIEAGRIQHKTLRKYAKSFAEILRFGENFGEEYARAVAEAERTRVQHD